MNESILFSYRCFKNHHKLRNLKQHKFIIGEYNNREWSEGHQIYSIYWLISYNGPAVIHEMVFLTELYLKQLETNFRCSASPQTAEIILKLKNNLYL
jgi:hypothetical protein